MAKCKLFLVRFSPNDWLLYRGTLDLALDFCGEDHDYVEIQEIPPDIFIPVWVRHGEPRFDCSGFFADCNPPFKPNWRLCEESWWRPIEEEEYVPEVDHAQIVGECVFHLESCANLLKNNMDSERLILAGAIEVLETEMEDVADQLEYLRANVNTWAATRAKYSRCQQEAAQ